jgi:translation initiation factor 2B subunit (eIF-2B alpha/beta/delta family)
VTAWFRGLCAGSGADASLTVESFAAQVRALRDLLRATGGGDFAAQCVAPRLLRVLAEEAAKAAAASAPRSAPAPAAASAASAVCEVRAACAAALAAWPAAAPAPAAAHAGAQQQAFAAVRSGVVDALDELASDLEFSPAALAAAAPDVFAHGDVVLVAGYDARVRDVLLAAHARRRLGEVLICEAAACAALVPAPGATPVLAGHALALELTSRAKPLSVTLIADAAASAVMHRVTKVLIGARAVAADGAVLADAPALLLALAAAQRVPVLVLANALAVSAWAQRSRKFYNIHSFFWGPCLPVPTAAFPPPTPHLPAAVSPARRGARRRCSGAACRAARQLRTGRRAAAARGRGRRRRLCVGCGLPARCRVRRQRQRRRRRRRRRGWADHRRGRPRRPAAGARHLAHHQRGRARTGASWARA